MLSKRNSFLLTLLLMLGDKKKKVAFHGFCFKFSRDKALSHCLHWASPTLGFNTDERQGQRLCVSGTSPGL